MRKLLTSPAQMPLTRIENQIYQNVLKYVADIALNLMAVKVENHPDNFTAWCQELHKLCKYNLNIDLLEPQQLKPLKKLQETLESGISVCQLKMLRIAPWPIFVSFIKKHEQLQSLVERLALLDYVQDIADKPLAAMIEEDLLTFTGKHSAKHDISIYNFDAEWFASTKGAKGFHRLLTSHACAFDQALMHIPLTGEVSTANYQAFVTAYKDVFEQHTDGEKAPMVVATRLLAMRRPDYFVALSNNNIDVYCQGLQITKFNNQDFNAYWQELIATIHSCTWFKQTAPEDLGELRLWQARAILADVFLFADQDQAQSSNYIRMRDKPTQIKIGVARSVKRSKESAESIVDKALSEDDIPEYLLEMRNTLINSVKDGKPVEKAISLMRSIFG